MWKPLRERHAISKVSIRIAFGDPLSSRFLQQLLNKAQILSEKLGLRSRQEVRQLEIKLGQNATTSLDKGPVSGARFEAFSSTVGESGLESSVTEQLHIDSEQIIYTNWNYSSWKRILMRLDELVLRLASEANSFTDITVVRLEYRDQFWFDGVFSAHNLGELLRTECEFVPSHIFDRTDLWHSHTGAFVNNEGEGKLLLQVNLDAAQQPKPDDNHTNVRWLNIMTAFERRMVGTSLEEAIDVANPNSYSILDELNAMHAGLKTTLSSIISSKMANSISLNG